MFKKSWRGIATEYTGRPGTSTLCNKKRIFPFVKAYQDEEKRLQKIHRTLEVLIKVEQDIQLTQ